MKSELRKIWYSGLRLFVLLTIIPVFGGCSLLGHPANTVKKEVKEPAPAVERYDGEKSREIAYIYTARKELSLTFNGMGDRETMTALLDELDAYGVKATFFLPGMRVAEEPEIAKAILARGHEIENNTLSQLDMNGLDYDSIYKEIRLANEVIERETGIQPRYIRTRSGVYPEDVPLAAAHLGMKAVVSYNINPKDRDMQSAEEIGEYVARYMSRGGIISMNTDINPEIVAAVKYIAQAADDIGYQLITLDELVENGGIRKSLEEIPGYDAAHINPDYNDANYELVYKVNTDRKEVALTFDDFGSDKTVTQILDILEEYDVKATFFLRAKGVEDNPNLARAMLEGGHDVANHSYSHPVVTTLTPEELQEDIVKAHQVITEAIQEPPVMLFRPPTGVVDDLRAKAIAAAGYPIIAMYDVTTLDWDTSNTADDIVNGVMSKTEEGSVILLHMLDDLHTIEALPRVLTGLKDKGYTFVKMADMIEDHNYAAGERKS